MMGTHRLQGKSWMDLSDMIDEKEEEIAALKAQLARVGEVIERFYNDDGLNGFGHMKCIATILSAEPKVLAVSTNVTEHTDADGLRYLVVYLNPTDLIYDNAETVIVLAKGVE